MKVEYISYPFVYTDDGNRIDITNIVGHPKVGSELIVREDGEYCVQAVTSDSECVNGVCPIK
jgi:hypothetical protein